MDQVWHVSSRLAWGTICLIWVASSCTEAPRKGAADASPDASDDLDPGPDVGNGDAGIDDAGPEPMLRSSRATYLDRLRGMWLGESIANWTGIVTEGQKREPPFYTDEDWQTDQGQPLFGGTIDFVFQDPWLADDDTNIEYVYAHLMTKHDTTALTGPQIADGWRKHINGWIWVSNARARELMSYGVGVPAAGLPSANEYSLYIDAQLTTEIFGAMAPGMPRRALEIAELPIRATAHGYAAHAAQYFVLLYALGPVVDSSLSPRDQIVWLVTEALRYLPETSKTSGVVTFVLDAYRTAVDEDRLDDWEAVRDAVAQRYQLEAETHGFVYRGWTESTVNFATGLVALLFGEGNYKRTIRIGTLSGWDSDNGTATMGGLLGLMLGAERLLDEFPDTEISDQYDLWATRDELPDHTPEQPGEDTFTLLAERALPLVEANILAGGGSVNADGSWLLPRLPPDVDPQLDNPLQRWTRRNANNRVRQAGGHVSVEVPGGVDGHAIADGVEHDFTGREQAFDLAPILGVQGAGQPLTFAVLYDEPVDVHTIRVIEGGPILFETPRDERLGAFEEMSVEIRVDGEWRTPVSGVSVSEPPDPNVPFQIIDFVLQSPTTADGVRLIATPAAETGGYATLAEIDALAPPGR